MKHPHFYPHKLVSSIWFANNHPDFCTWLDHKNKLECFDDSVFKLVNGRMRNETETAHTEDSVNGVRI